MLRKLELSILIGFILTICMSLLTGFSNFAGECGEISDKLLRLHVIANSDSDADQAIKLAVRDRVLAECGDLLFDNAGKQAAKDELSLQLPRIEQAANALLAENGFAYTASATIEKRWFDIRVYNTVTLPAGRYDALCLRLGEARGKNWWCVVFPPMCLPAASEQEALKEVLSEDELKIVTEQNTYHVRFKLLELYEQLIGENKK